MFGLREVTPHFLALGFEYIPLGDRNRAGVPVEVVHATFYIAYFTAITTQNMKKNKKFCVAAGRPTARTKRDTRV